MNRQERLAKIRIEKYAKKDVAIAEVVGQNPDGKFVIEFDGDPKKRRAFPDKGWGLIVGNWVVVAVPDGNLNRAQIVEIADVLIDPIENAWG